jgi:hypothetical protein
VLHAGSGWGDNPLVEAAAEVCILSNTAMKLSTTRDP